MTRWQTGSWETATFCTLSVQHQQTSQPLSFFSLCISLRLQTGFMTDCIPFKEVYFITVKEDTALFWCRTLTWLLHCSTWLHQGYWHYRIRLIQWLIDMYVASSCWHMWIIHKLEHLLNTSFIVILNPVKLHKSLREHNCMRASLMHGLKHVKPYLQITRLKWTVVSQKKLTSPGMHS